MFSAELQTDLLYLSSPGSHVCASLFAELSWLLGKLFYFLLFLFPWQIHWKTNRKGNMRSVSDIWICLQWLMWWRQVVVAGTAWWLDSNGWGQKETKVGGGGGPKGVLMCKSVRVHNEDQRTFWTKLNSTPPHNPWPFPQLTIFQKKGSKDQPASDCYHPSSCNSHNFLVFICTRKLPLAVVWYCISRSRCCSVLFFAS